MSLKESRAKDCPSGHGRTLGSKGRLDSKLVMYDIWQSIRGVEESESTESTDISHEKRGFNLG